MNSKRRNIFTAIWLMVVLGIAYGSLIPFRLTWDALPSSLENLDVVPFKDVPILDMLQNILFYIPAGFLGVLATGRFRLALAIAGALSIMMEGLQLMIYTRFTTTTDIILNVLGAYLGAVSAMFLLGRLPPGISVKIHGIYQKIKPVVPILIFYLVCLFGLLVPFWPPPTSARITSAFETFCARFFSLGQWQFEFIRDMVRFGFLGYFIGLFCENHRLRPWLGQSTVLLLLACLSLGLISYFFGPHPLAFNTLLLLFFGGTCGALSSAVRSASHARMLILSVLTASVCVLELVLGLYPFKFTSNSGGFLIIPFVRLYYTYPLYAAGFFIEQFLYYLPAGFLLGSLFQKRILQKPFYLALGCLLLLFMEVVQSWSRHHFCDITDWIVQTGGLLCGILMATLYKHLYLRTTC